MAVGWIDLPQGWRLQDVQAVLNVVIATLSAIAIFVCARWCWQSSFPKIGQRSVPLKDLLTIGTLGEALDVVMLLRWRSLSIQNSKLLGQCVVVVFFSVVALVSGPIARYSSRHSFKLNPLEISGSVAWRFHDCIISAPVTWNATFTSLDRARFPHDQLLDFVPDTTVDWRYRAEEWNSSWSFDCLPTHETAIDLEDVGNCTSNMPDEIPGLQRIISTEMFNTSNGEMGWWHGDYREDNVLKDVLMLIAAVKTTEIDDTSDQVHEIALELAAVHMHNVNVKPEDEDSACDFGTGPVQSASYTKIQCVVRRLPGRMDDEYAAFPDGMVPSCLAQAAVQNYQARFISESVNGKPPGIVAPEDLVRFTQVWMATKDTQNLLTVARSISVQVGIVQLSAAFLAFVLLVFVLIVLGLAAYAYGYLRHRRVFKSRPQSKIDWMIETIDETRGGHGGDEDGQPTPNLQSDETKTGRAEASSAEKRRSLFENAIYHLDREVCAQRNPDCVARSGANEADESPEGLLGEGDSVRPTTTKTTPNAEKPSDSLDTRVSTEVVGAPIVPA
ncbi:hypothetical protein PV08_10544 [Exophiala spinifera]|uniref:Uncharacterized protein n=1 Tax=Exophiala spinifera TaxID=91928 RepID=A0A0D2BIQ5_9EURO|nr:uncharacterized protein PV08_10544 [Exophiala spinifera]KIW11244.1 hypothetical protein PV08_10544 [Exophiala spinifera]